MRKWIIVLMCVLCSTIALADITQWMVDMSSHNAGVEVKKGMVYEGNNAEINLIIHRLTIGRYTNKYDSDKLFPKRSFETNNEGVLFGAYHVAYPSSDGKSQAQGFIRAIKEHSVPDQPIILALDWEHTCVKWNYNEKGQKQTCAQEGLVPPSWALEWLEEVERLTGKKPLVYTSYRALRLFTKWFKDNPEFVSKLTSYPLWIARYHSKGGSYSFPTDEEMYPWTDWTFWQFAEGKAIGPTKRISPKIKDNPIDTNFFNGARSEIHNFFEKYAWIPN